MRKTEGVCVEYDNYDNCDNRKANALPLSFPKKGWLFSGLDF